MDNKAWTLGIDFGTSNTAAAHTNPVKGNVEVVNLSHSQSTMTSSVFLEDEKTIEVGEVAFNRAVSNPAGFISSPKRLVPQHVFHINGCDVPSSMPIAAVLKSVVDRASREHGGVPPQELVLTHPEAWSEEEINVLLEAASDLGLSMDKIKTISEPQAAAHYYSQAEQLKPGDKIAVFDFGGGTLDIAVLEAQSGGSFSVIAARGDNNLGGKTFDALVRRWVDSQLEEQDPELASYLRQSAPISERHAMEDAIRRAKELLSEAATATINFQAAGENHRIQITREELESIIAPHINKAVNLTRSTLQEAGVNSPDGIKALYLTGGSSRIPTVQEALKTLGPVATLDNPKTVVVQGALSAVMPVISNITTQNTGFGPAPTQAPATNAYGANPFQGGPNPATSAAPQQMGGQAPQSPYGASSVAQSQFDADSSSKKKWPMFAIAGVAVLALVGGGIAVFGKNGEETVNAGGSSQPSQDVSQTESSNSTAPATSTESATSGRDRAIAKLPEKLKGLVSKCSSGISSNSESARCDIDKENDDAAKFFDVSPTGSYPYLNISVSESEAKSKRAAIRDRINQYEEASFENGKPQAYGVRNDGGEKFQAEYVNIDDQIYIQVFGVKDAKAAKKLLEYAGLV